MKTINANGMIITPASTLLALAQSQLYWAMHSAQRLSLEHLTLYSMVEVIREIVGDKEKFYVYPTPNTLCGIPYVIDDTLDKSWIELRLSGYVLVRIENLAIPVGM